MNRCVPPELGDFTPASRVRKSFFDHASMYTAFEKLKISGAIDEEGDSSRALGVYGCGAYGCAVALEDTRLVAKITMDEAEVHGWELIWSRQIENPLISDAFVRVHHVEQIKSRGNDPCWVITRESARPAFVRQDNTSGLWSSKETNEYITRSNMMSDVAWASDFGNPFSLDLSYIMDDLGFDIDKEACRRINLLRDGFNTVDCAEMMAFKVARELIPVRDQEDRDLIYDHWVRMFIEKLDEIKTGPFTGIRVGLQEYMSYPDVPWITDLHAGNLGWRKKCESDPPTSLVIYDFQGKLIER